MPTALQKLHEEAQEHIEATDDLLTSKENFNLAAIGKLLESLTGGIEDLVKTSQETQYYDKDLCSSLKDTVSQLVNAISKIKPPTVTVSPNISVDVSPIVEEISSQNKTIIALIEKMGNGNNSDELYRLVVAMIGKQNTFLENSFKQTDYSSQFDRLISLLSQRQNLEEIKIMRNDYGVQSLKPIYKSNS